MTQPLRSTLMVGTVRHRRTNPTSYALEHDVWYFGLRLDELPEVFALTRLLRRNRRAVVSFRDADFLPQVAADLPRDFADHLRTEGLDAAGWQVELIANLRVFGYVFNPASFYLCRDTDGLLRAVVVEVHNTYGDRHLYTLRPTTPVAAEGAAFSSSMAKDFFVSPFIGPDGRYRVTVRERGTNLNLAIALRDGDELVLATSLVLHRRPLTRANLVRLLARNPLVTYRTIALIHWHALRLWLKGVPFLHHAARPELAEDGR
jgi:DUF1365 family protein